MLAATAPTLSMLGAASAKLSMTNVVSTGSVTSATSLSSKKWLTQQPAGAYTTARTCAGGRRLFEWDTHVERTAASAAAMLGDPTGVTAPAASALPALLAALGRPEALRRRLDAAVSAAVCEYSASNGQPAGELKVTVLVTWDGDATTVGCHVAPLPPLPAPPVRVEVRGAPRANAAAKDSSWVAERAPLEALMRGSNVGDVNELLLVSDDGAILEGSQTNFFAIEPAGAGKPSHVRTAGDGVLEGTVRRLLLEVCEREGIPVVLTPPQLADAARWEGAMISSTSRLLLPVDELYVPQPGACAEEADRVRRFGNGDGSLAARLRALVAEEVEAHSSALRA